MEPHHPIMNGYAEKRLRASARPDNPLRNRSAAPGNGTAASCAAPFRVNRRARLLGLPQLLGNPVIPVNACVHVNPLNAWLVSLKAPVALPPMFIVRPDGERNGPVSLADSAFRSAVMVGPLVLPVGTGFGPLVKREKV